MRERETCKDLVLLVADKDMAYAVSGVLHRTKSLGIRDITERIYVHPERDPGCLLWGHDFLRPFLNQYSHAIVLLDHHGSGNEQLGPEELEMRVEKNLSNSGWGSRAAAIVIAPELEVWVWSDSPHVEAVLGWERRQPDLRTWLGQEGLIDPSRAKPDRPKQAMEEALRFARKPRSSSLYGELAKQVSLQHCTDRAFERLKTLLQAWFPQVGE